MCSIEFLALFYYNNTILYSFLDVTNHVLQLNPHCLTLWNPRATTVDSPPFCRPGYGRQRSTQEFIIIVYLRLRNRMRYAWTSHPAIDISAHTRIGVCLTYNIAFESRTYGKYLPTQTHYRA